VEKKTKTSRGKRGAKTIIGPCKQYRIQWEGFSSSATGVTIIYLGLSYWYHLCISIASNTGNRYQLGGLGEEEL